jgi:hypothetical protein
MEIGFSFANDEKAHEVVADELIGFLKQAVTGTESGYYKAFKTKGEDLNFLKESEAKNSIVISLIKYLNGCYKSLIISDDFYVLKIFRPVQQIFHHSEKCILIMIASAINHIESELNRKNFDTSSYENYMSSISEEMNKLSEYIESFKKILQTHLLKRECTGKNIRDENPNEALFEISENKN